MIDVMAIPANLDAFLPREDFHAEGDVPPINEFSEMGLTELREQWVHILRKPDFQRTTDDWDADHIMQFIKSFAEGDVIPGVIFWASPRTGNILVIDGAHRISAMLAWIFDDYGDMAKSREFIGFQENSDQIDAADAARAAVKAHVGTFKEVSDAAADPNAKKRLKLLAASMTAMRFRIQWMRADARKAEESFYRINLRSVALNKTEIKLIRHRDKPEPIATRAIVQNASGHPFWKRFPAKQAQETISIAKEIHKLLFSPPLANEIKTAHLPIAGKSYAGTAMDIALEIVEFAKKQSPKQPIRGTAKKTVVLLENVREILLKINGKDSGCLGLHPAVYFYSFATGKHQPAALMAVLKWISGFDKNRLKAFTSVRKYFEDFLLTNARALGEIVSTRGSRGRSVGTLISYYDLVLDELIKGAAPKAILKEMRKHPKLKPFAEKLPDFTEYGKEFSTETKSAVFLADALKASPKCRVCGARYQPDSVNADHTQPKSKGGIGNPKNMGPTHYYCNSGKRTLEPLIAAAWQRIEAQLVPTRKSQPHSKPAQLPSSQKA
jgi:hypothetical protein